MANNRSNLFVDIKARDQVTPTVKTIQSTIIRFVGAITASLVAVRGVAFPVEQAAAFEKELKNVQKTTNFTDLQIKGLGNTLNKMATGLVASQVELAQIAATAGQLGLGTQGVEAIESFTQSVARATLTFGIGADALSTYAAQILNVFQIPTTDLEKVFSAINEVSNNSVASAEKLIDIIKRVGNVAGLTVTEVTALAAQSQDLGVSSEVAGTTLVKQFSNMQAKAKEFANVMSITTDSWVERVERDALGAFKDVLVQIGQLDTAAQATAIRDLFGGGRIFSLASKQVTDAANGFQILDKSLKNASQAYQDGTSSIKEYDIVASSLSGRFQNLKNVFNELALQAGQTLIPVLKEMTQSVKEFLQSDGVVRFIDSISESMERGLGAIRQFGAAAAELEIVWRNLLPILSLLIKLKLAGVLFGMAKAVLAFGQNAATKFGLATGLLGKYSTAALAAAAATEKLNAAAIKAAAAAGNFKPITKTPLASQAATLAAKTQAREVDGGRAAAQRAAVVLQREMIANNEVLLVQGKAQAAGTLQGVSALRLQLEVIKQKIQSEQVSFAAREKILLAEAAQFGVNNKNRAAILTQLDLERKTHLKIVQMLEIKATWQAQSVAMSQKQLATEAAIARSLERQGNNLKANLAKQVLAAKASRKALLASTAAAAAPTSFLGSIGKLFANSGGTKAVLLAAGKFGLKLAGTVFGVGLWATVLYTALEPLFGDFFKDVFDGAKKILEDSFGFTFDFEEDKKQAAAKKAEAAARDLAATSIEAYTEAMKELPGLQTQLANAIDNGDDAAVSELSTKIANLLGTAVTGVDAKLGNVSNTIAEWQPLIEAARLKMEKLNREFQAAKSARENAEAVPIAQGSGLGSSGADDFNRYRLAAIEKTKAAQKKASEALIENMADETTAVKVVTAAEKDRQKLYIERGLLVRQLTETGGQQNPTRSFEGDVFIVALAAQKQISKELADQEIKLKNQQTLVDDYKDAGAEKVEQLREANLLLEQEKAKFREIGDREKEIVEVTKGLKKELEDTFSPEKNLTKYLEGLDATALGIQAVEAKTRIAKNESRLFSQTIATGYAVITKSVQNIQRLDASLQSLAKNGALLESLSSAIVGIGDNVNSIVAGAFRDLLDIQNKFKEGDEATKRASDLTESLRTDSTLRGISEQSAKRIADYEEKAAKARDKGYEFEAKRYDRLAEDEKVRESRLRTEREARLEIASIQQGVAANLQKQAGQEAVLVDLRERQLAAAKERDALLAQGTNADAGALGAAKQKAQDLEAEMLQLLEITRANDEELRGFGTRLAEIANTQVSLDGITIAGGTTALKDKFDFTAIFKEIDEGSKGYNAFLSTTAQRAADASKETIKAFTQIKNAIKTMKEDAEITIRGRVDTTFANAILEGLSLLSELRAAAGSDQVDIDAATRRVTEVLDRIATAGSKNDGIIIPLKIEQVTPPTIDAALAQGQAMIDGGDPLTVDIAPVVPEGYKFPEGDIPKVTAEYEFSPADKKVDIKKELDRLIRENGGEKGTSVPVTVTADPLAMKDSLDDSTEAYKGTIDVIANIVGTTGGAAAVTAATGGYIRGPGTTTSDSILARLSNKEYVVKAKAVSHYGVDFLRQLNNMRLPKFNTGGYVQAAPQSYGVGLYDALNSVNVRNLPKFNNGGLVNAASAASASAGESTVNINMGGRRATLRGEKAQIRNLVNMLNDIEAVR